MTYLVPTKPVLHNSTNIAGAPRAANLSKSLAICCPECPNLCQAARPIARGATRSRWLGVESLRNGAKHWRSGRGAGRAGTQNCENNPMQRIDGASPHPKTQDLAWLGGNRSRIEGTGTWARS